MRFVCVRLVSGPLVSVWIKNQSTQKIDEGSFNMCAVKWENMEDALNDD